MTPAEQRQLISYIAPAAPATRRPAAGPLPRLRPEIGFTPKWYRSKLGIDFGRRWHTDPAYRRRTVLQMRELLRQRFPGTRIGGIDRPQRPLDLLTGTLGTCTVAAIYGVPIVYAQDNWPSSAHQYLRHDQLADLSPPDLDTNPCFQKLLEQVEWIAGREGRVEGYVNWQGVLNNAQRLRGQQLFCDMIDRPELARHLFDCVCTTMIEAARRLHARQRTTGVEIGFFTVSNCLVNMISPRQYAELLLPLDRRMAETFGLLGIHNCAWTADPYIEHYATVGHLGYIDMGLDSELRRARDAFPHARRAIMYTPMDLANKPPQTIRQDLRRIARLYAPCDVVLADIEDGTPDQRVLAVLEFCAELSREKQA